jgi:predicted DNA-binding transcriptional regulator AlpA
MERRLLTREQAAAYCGLSPIAFGDWVRKGRLPSSLNGTHRWDRKAIDAALDRLSGLAETPSKSEVDEWLERRHARTS